MATSNNIEWLFNMAKHILRSNHKRMSLITFVDTLFFKINRSFWDIIMLEKSTKVSSVRGTDRYDDLF